MVDRFMGRGDSPFGSSSWIESQVLLVVGLWHQVPIPMGACIAWFGNGLFANGATDRYHITEFIE
jgi:hypothetical protein